VVRRTVAFEFPLRVLLIWTVLAVFALEDNVRLPVVIPMTVRKERSVYTEHVFCLVLVIHNVLPIKLALEELVQSDVEAIKTARQTKLVSPINAKVKYFGFPSFPSLSFCLSSGLYSYDFMVG